MWKRARAWPDGRTKQSREWFGIVRKKIKNGKVASIIAEIREEISVKELPDETRKILENLIAYLETHAEHMSYDKFKAMGFPIGSGLYSRDLRGLECVRANKDLIICFT